MTFVAIALGLVGMACSAVVLKAYALGAPVR
ncbi:hypothetical protein DFR50_10477 [Roseiarcus fermentans]|uniref:Uncharacterized protein n=1 Tax=Roseiarcus fermentans TaxID=1473586 RepID=A0A366FRW4_9HYPH|nr:hypothetical protein DFR50_10477 [Roseiarcus fermentans]